MLCFMMKFRFILRHVMISPQHYRRFLMRFLLVALLLYISPISPSHSYMYVNVRDWQSIKLKCATIGKKVSWTRDERKRKNWKSSQKPVFLSCHSPHLLLFHLRNFLCDCVYGICSISYFSIWHNDEKINFGIKNKMSNGLIYSKRNEWEKNIKFQPRELNVIP